MEYIINKEKDGFLFNPNRNVIEIYLSQEVYERLTVDELSLYISDSLTHEYIHKVLYDAYGITVTKLFDTKQQYFRNTILHEKIVRFHNVYASNAQMTHHEFIKKYGINSFFNEIFVTPDDIIHAKLICRS